MGSTPGRAARLFFCMSLVALVASVSAAEPAHGKITYLAGARVYLDQGRDRGLQAGTVLSVSRGGKVIGQLEVVHVSDHRAAAKVSSAERALRLDDEVLFPTAPESVPTEPAAARQPAYVALPESQLARDWNLALAGESLAPVAYTPDMARGGRAVRAAAETTLLAAADVPALSRRRLEQGIALQARGDDVGARGLDARIRADFDLHYDPVTDRYLPGRRAYPLVREVAVRYQSPRAGWSGTVGRFRPGVRQSDLVDGAQVAWTGRQLGLVVFGGLKPSMLELIPRPDRQVYGVALNVRPMPGSLKWSGQLGYGGDLSGGALARQTLAVDNHLRWRRLTAHQSVTLDYLAAGGSADGQTGVDLAELSAGGSYRFGERLELSLRGRLLDRALLAADAAELPEAWVEQLSGRRLMRADGGARVVLSERQAVQPYLFWHEEAYPDRDPLRIRGGGASWHLSNLFGGPLALDLSGDYGDGTQQQASLQLTVQGPIAENRLRLAGGLLNFWSFGHESGIHTLQHLVQARLDGRVFERAHAWAALMGGLDMNIAAGPAMPGGVLMGELGGTYLW